MEIRGPPIPNPATARNKLTWSVLRPLAAQEAAIIMPDASSAHLEPALSKNAPQGTAEAMKIKGQAPSIKPMVLSLMFRS